MKKTLILGGTQFIGRNLVERLQEMEDYEITLFNRQKTHADLFPEIKKIKGNRETEDLNQIANEKWDYIIDLSGYYPDSLSRVLNCISDNLQKFIFISTCSVYDNETNRIQLRDEQSKTLSCDDSQKVDRTPTSYGNRKAECERILQKSGIPYIILRPSLVFGKYDPTDRFYYWLYQVKQNDTLLLPENGVRRFSITYVHDLVEAILHAINSYSNNDIYNVITNPQTSILQIVDLAGELLNKKFHTVNASAEFLKENKISQWVNMPLWINGDYFTYSNRKLTNDFGFEFTELKNGIRNSINYYASLNWPEPAYGIKENSRKVLLSKLNLYQLKN